MFVCECECVTDHAVVCVQTGVCVCVCGAGAAGMTRWWGPSSMQDSMHVVMSLSSL